MGEVARLHVIRVLVGGRDRRFLRAASAMLAHGGCATKSTEKASELQPIVHRWRPHVVVLDASGGLGAAVRTAAAIEASHPATSVVLVGDGPDAGRCGALPKWSALDHLAESVERRYRGEHSTQGDLHVVP